MVALDNVYFRAAFFTLMAFLSKGGETALRFQDYWTKDHLRTNAIERENIDNVSTIDIS